jgi:amidase
VENANFSEYNTLNEGSYSNLVLEADIISDLPKEDLSKLTYNPNNIHSLADLRNFTHTSPLKTGLKGIL